MYIIFLVPLAFFYTLRSQFLGSSSIQPKLVSGKGAKKKVEDTYEVQIVSFSR